MSQWIIVSSCVRPMARHQCVHQRICTLVLIRALPFLMTKGRSRSQSWLLQKQESQDWLPIAAKLLGWYPGAHTLHQREMRLSTIDRKVLSRWLALSNSIERGQPSHRKAKQSVSTHQNPFLVCWHKELALYVITSFHSHVQHKISS